ncbi:hypothetical protein M8818_000709 [Zalaria obscura]|uniref:Uncharacterized protein n=1 Tax=Zalaria obscura TaxID=2024903 RepID=A0ACC3SMK0_9PEZI
MAVWRGARSKMRTQYKRRLRDAQIRVADGHLTNTESASPPLMTSPSPKMVVSDALQAGKHRKMSCTAAEAPSPRQSNIPRNAPRME